MDTELKAKWVAALRSGEYRQGSNHLEKNKHFCCLGVLCKVAGWPTGVDDLDLGGTPVEYYQPAIQNLPAGSLSKLIKLNDHTRATFAQIADYIEAHL